jgi:hypothetical protein
MYATCQQLQAQARAHAAAASGLLAHTELRLHMPPSIALATRGRLQGLRLQLALLDREFDDLGIVLLVEMYFFYLYDGVTSCKLAVHMQMPIAMLGLWFHLRWNSYLWMKLFVHSGADYDTLRALDSDNTSTTPSMSEEQINALPVHKYRVAGSEK